MIESIMCIGIGFLVAVLIGVVVVPLVHTRAVRLTMRRLEATTPLSMKEMRADKDQLRAEFAMSTRRLEMSVETLRTNSTSQLAELNKKSDIINQLKIEVGKKDAIVFALEARNKALRDQLHATEEELSVKTRAPERTENIVLVEGFSQVKAEVARLASALEDLKSPIEPILFAKNGVYVPANVAVGGAP